ncbi:hypothetical protein O3P69_008611 [Scylla paramamosain]|uniref:Uncharacterized protein n=1 Tax=Scylla paramamosain TaxID=85552 RepID=A0AAW0SM83_SCYPA
MASPQGEGSHILQGIRHAVGLLAPALPPASATLPQALYPCRRQLSPLPILWRKLAKQPSASSFVAAPARPASHGGPTNILQVCDFLSQHGHFSLLPLDLFLQFKAFGCLAAHTLSEICSKCKTERVCSKLITVFNGPNRMAMKYCTSY